MLQGINRVYEAVEGVVFDALIKVTVPSLIWWVSRGLHREDLSEELKEFWKDYKVPDED